MKSWAVLLVIAVAAWFGYRHWVAPGTSPGDSAVSDEAGTGAGMGAGSATERAVADADSRTERAPPGQDAANGSAVAGSTGRSLGIDLDIGAPAAPAGQAPAGAQTGDGTPAIAPGSDEAKAWELHAALVKAATEKKVDEVRALRQRILREYPETDPARYLLFDEGRAWYQQFKTLGRTEEGLAAAREARRLMTPALFIARAEPAQKDRVREGLRECSDAIVFGRRPVEGVLRTYTPQRGDTLGGLRAKVFKPQWGAEATPELIAAVSGLRGPEAMRAGVPVLVPLGKVTIVVVKEEFRLYYLLDGAYVRDYPVGLGRLSSTPEAVFTIDSKIVDPDWWSPEGRKIPHGDPNNILGSRWLGFANTAQYSGFGIHGTTDPASIGREQSSGCVRMLRADVEQLFAWTPHGARVVIRAR